jgi:hypothetical protein
LFADEHSEEGLAGFPMDLHIIGVPFESGPNGFNNRQAS